VRFKSRVPPVMGKFGAKVAVAMSDSATSARVLKLTILLPDLYRMWMWRTCCLLLRATLHFLYMYNGPESSPKCPGT
jgi:hypothetical protein